MKVTNRRPKWLKMINAMIRDHRDDPGVVHALNQVRDRLLMPMSHILAKVPGNSIGERIAKVGVSRQAYYKWLNGLSRPNEAQAKRLEQLTGIPAKKIRGTTRLAPPAPTPTTPPIAAR